jgi:hypothetical protein
VTIVYDGDGNRVSKTVAGVTTTYLVDTLNPIRTASRNLQRSTFEEPRHHDYCDRQQREMAAVRAPNILVEALLQ